VAGVDRLVELVRQRGSKKDAAQSIEGSAANNRREKDDTDVVIQFVQHVSLRMNANRRAYATPRAVTRDLMGRPAKGAKKTAVQA
jgi:hypothetical protein